MKSRPDLEWEQHRILTFIRENADPSGKVVIPVSGGLDSDVVARLCALAIGRERIRLFIAAQEGMEEKYLDNAKRLAEDIGVKLAVISLGSMNRKLIEALHAAAPCESFDPESLLDPARANVSLRTAILSSYQDKGYLVTSNSNRTEIELGFFLPFGDNLGHFKPIAHLYKSEVVMLAEHLGSRREVIEQPPSAGFWEGETDLEDLAYWLHYGGPIPGGTVFTEEDSRQVARLLSLLSQEKIDRCLIGLNEGRNDGQIAEETALPERIVSAVRALKKKAASGKNRPLLAALERTDSCSILS